MKMRRFSPKAIAISLAAIFTLAAPSFAEQAQEDSSARISYEDLKASIDDKAKSANDNLRADGKLPEIFQKAVQGCTVDGYIYRLPYNIELNFDQLSAASGNDTPEQQKSLFGRLTHEAPGTILGVVGAEDYMDTLKGMTESIHEDMQVTAGRLIDEAHSEFITRPLFDELVTVALDDIEKGFEQRYGVHLTLSTSEPKKQGGRCAVAPEENEQAITDDAQNNVVQPQTPAVRVGLFDNFKTPPTYVDANTGIEYSALGDTLNPKHVIVLLHQMGDNHEGIISQLSRLLSLQLKNTLIITPKGPLSYEDIYSAQMIREAKAQNPNITPEELRAWYKPIMDDDLIGRDASELEGLLRERVTDISKTLNIFIDDQLKKYGLDGDNLFIYGHSETATQTAVYAALEREKVAGVLAHSAPVFVAPEEPNHKAQVILVAGNNQLTMPGGQYFQRTYNILQESGLNLKSHILPNSDAAITQESFELLFNYCANLLNAETRTQREIDSFLNNEASYLKPVEPEPKP